MDLSQEQFNLPEKDGPENDDPSRQYLIFESGSKRFALGLLDLRNIIPLRNITTVPGSPDHFLGIISLRGTIIPVLDFSAILRLPGDSGTKSTILIVKDDDESLGIPIEKIIHMITIHDDDILPVREYVKEENIDFYDGVFRHGEQYGLILNMSNLLDKTRDPVNE